MCCCVKDVFQWMMTHEVASGLCAASWKCTHFRPLMCLLPCFDSASIIWQCCVSSPLSAQCFTSIGFESSHCCTSSYQKHNEALWVADLNSGFLSFCSQGSPHPSNVCPVLQLLQYSLHCEMTHYLKADTETALNLLNIFAVIYAPLPYGREAIHSFNSVCKMKVMHRHYSLH